MFYATHCLLGQAKEAVDGCPMLILRILFRMPFTIVRNLIDGIMPEARHIRIDVLAISDLLAKMQNCAIVSDH